MGNKDDNLLIELLESSNKVEQNKGFKLLYANYADEFSNYLVKLNATKQDADDIFQEAILALYMNIRSRKFQLTSSLSTYLLSIGKNQWFKRLRKLSKEKDVDNIEINDWELDISELMVKKEEINSIYKLMSKLGEGCYKVLIYFYVEKMRMKEIAVQLGFANDQVARNKKSKCLEQLIKLYNKENG